jgi:hypothetical protein
MGTKSENGKAWMYVDRAVRHRLNLYKAVLGIKDDSVLDQSETIAALLDRVGAPGDTAVERMTTQPAVPQ